VPRAACSGLLLGLLFALGMRCWPVASYRYCSGPSPAAESWPLVVDVPRARMVFQVDPATGLGEIPVRGRFARAAAVIEARVGGGPWRTLDLAATNGTFAGTLTDQPVGRTTLEVRFAGEPASAVPVADVGVGNVVVIAGQSNAVMWLASRHQTAMGVSSVANPDAYWPNDPRLVQWANDPLHTCFPPAGSIWPELGDRVVVGSGGVPLMFIAAAQPGTGLVDPPDWRPGGPAWNDALEQIDFATGGQRCPALVLWFQGESDAGQQVSQAAYEAGLAEFGDALQAEFACAAPVPIVVGVIGAIDRSTYEPGVITPEQVAAIQNAQRAAPQLRPYFHPGPDTSDWHSFPLRTLHFTDAAYPALLEAWCASISGVGGLACAP
jgi:hypothetical protein